MVHTNIRILCCVTPGWKLLFAAANFCLEALLESSLTGPWRLHHLQLKRVHVQPNWFWLDGTFICYTHYPSLLLFVRTSAAAVSQSFYISLSSTSGFTASRRKHLARFFLTQRFCTNWVCSWCSSVPWNMIIWCSHDGATFHAIFLALWLAQINATYLHRIDGLQHFHLHWSRPIETEYSELQHTVQLHQECCRLLFSLFFTFIVGHNGTNWDNLCWVTQLQVLLTIQGS